MNESKDLTERLASMTAERNQDQEPIEQEEQPVEQVEATDANDVAPEQTEVAQAVQSSVQPQKESGHFKKLRESLERSEREKEQLYEILAKVNQPAQQQIPQQPKYAEPEFEDNDFVPRNYVDRKLRETQQQLGQYQQALYEQMVTNQLQTQYTDFSQVLSKDNISKLRDEHPEIAASLAANPDMSSKAHATYKIIKKLGLDVPEPNYEPVKAKMAANALKPRPATANPLSQANAFDYHRMSESEMQREREETERAIRG